MAHCECRSESGFPPSLLILQFREDPIKQNANSVEKLSGGSTMLIKSSLRRSVERLPTEVSSVETSHFPPLVSSKEIRVKNLIACTLMMAIPAVGMAEELKSGPQAGSRIGAFYVTKCAGAEDDGVKEGKNLCYRCRNGSRPQVMVFTRSTDAKVLELVKELDNAIAKHEDDGLTAFVNLMGDSKDDLTAAAKKLAAASSSKNVPIVVPNEFENGPDNYGIHPKAAITIVLANESVVKSSIAVSDVSKLQTNAVIKDIAKML